MRDILSDTLVRIKNAQKVRSPEVFLYNPTPKICLNLLNILYKEGYIRGFVRVSDNNKQDCFKVLLKYSYDNSPVIKNARRISKPGKRVYVSVTSLWKIKNGMGILIISSPHGLVTDNDARLLNCGGEVLCHIQ